MDVIGTGSDFEQPLRIAAKRYDLDAEAPDRRRPGRTCRSRPHGHTGRRGPRLPFTEFDAMALAGIGLLLLLAGAAQRRFGVKRRS